MRICKCCVVLWDALKERWVGAIIALDDTTGGCGWIRTGIYGCYSWSRWQQTTRDGRRTRQFQGEIGPSLVRNHGQCSYLKAGVKAVLASRPPGGSLAISRWPPITTPLPPRAIGRSLSTTQRRSVAKTSKHQDWSKSNSWVTRLDQARGWSAVAESTCSSYSSHCSTIFTVPLKTSATPRLLLPLRAPIPLSSSAVSFC